MLFLFLEKKGLTLWCYLDLVTVYALVYGALNTAVEYLYGFFFCSFLCSIYIDFNGLLFILDTSLVWLWILSGRFTQFEFRNFLLISNFEYMYFMYVKKQEHS